MAEFGGADRRWRPKKTLSEPREKIGSPGRPEAVVAQVNLGIPGLLTTTSR